MQVEFSDYCHREVEFNYYTTEVGTSFFVDLSKHSLLSVHPVCIPYHVREREITKRQG